MWGWALETVYPGRRRYHQCFSEWVGCQHSLHCAVRALLLV